MSMGLSHIANQKSRRRLRKDSICPCGTGKKYGICCKKRGIEYTYNREGNTARTVKMNSEMKEAALGAMQSYEEIFGRKAVDDDPLFLEMTLYSEEEIADKTEEALKYAFGLPEEDLYAYRKLGYVVTKENKHNAPSKNLEEWNNAKKEYFEILSGKKLESDPAAELQDHLENWVVKLIHLFALILYKSEEDLKRADLFKGINLKNYSLFCLTKHLKTMKATRALTTHYFNEDTFSLIRTMYENYLQISTIVHNPDQIQKELLAKVGLHLGTHKQEYDYIIENSTGIKTKVLSNKQRAALDKDFNHENMQLYFTMYEYLSYFIHPDIRVAGQYFKDGYLSHNHNNNQLVVFYYINFVNVMLLFDLLKSNIFNGQNQEDIRSFTKQVSDLLLKIATITKASDKIIKNRLQKMLKSKLLK